MSQPQIRIDLFQNSGDGPMLKPEIIPPTTPVTITVIGKANGTSTIVDPQNVSLNIINVTDANRWTTARNIVVTLSQQGNTAVDGSANVTLGVQGVLPVVNGGTGQSTLAGLGPAIGFNSPANSNSFGGWTDDAIVGARAPVTGTYAVTNNFTGVVVPIQANQQISQAANLTGNGWWWRLS